MKYKFILFLPGYFKVQLMSGSPTPQAQSLTRAYRWFQEAEMEKSALLFSTSIPCGPFHNYAQAQTLNPNAKPPHSILKDPRYG